MMNMGKKGGDLDGPHLILAVFDEENCELEVDLLELILEVRIESPCLSMKKLWALHLNEEPNGRVSFLLEAFFKDSVRKHRLSIEGADLKGGVFNGRGLELLAIASEGSQSQR